jgi:anhydro-N-acetylmuramic acid kinase
MANRLSQIKQGIEMKIFTALGLMSGTSMDGIDIALIRSDGKSFVERGPSLLVPYESEFRQRIERGLKDASRIHHRAERPGDLVSLEYDITRLHTAVILRFLAEQDISAGEIDCIGFHGQTVLHRPGDFLTVQLGSGQQLADDTGIEVIYDLRANDMLQGGQGAPLVPVYHRALAHGLLEELTGANALAFVNIGGISNITYVGSDDQLIAFDSGPGNGLIDQWVERHAGVGYDEGGKIAKGGEIVRSICEHYLEHPYYDLPVPKSLDRKDFEPLMDEDISIVDGARSLARVTALAILKSFDQLPSIPAICVICGGGALNEVIVGDLRILAQEKGAKVITADEAGLSSMAVEAEAFAYLAIRAKLGKALTYPTTTGCRSPVSGGISALPKITPSFSKRAV